MTQDRILGMDCKKHQKIFLLSGLGLSNKEVAKLASTNVGHVFNVLKDYRAHPEKAESIKILIGSSPVVTNDADQSASE